MVDISESVCDYIQFVYTVNMDIESFFWTIYTYFNAFISQPENKFMRSFDIKHMYISYFYGDALCKISRYVQIMYCLFTLGMFFM